MLMTNTVTRQISGAPMVSASVPVPKGGVPLTILSSDGQLHEGGDIDLDVTDTFARGLYRDMALARRFDLEAYHLQRQGELGLWVSCRGQEAAQVGSIRAVANDDFVFPAYREHAAALCRGIAPAELLSQWRGTSHSGWDPADYNFHIYSLVLATQVLHATGYAMALSADRDTDTSANDVVLSYFGDGAASQGDASEALNWAAVFNAPIVFLCQNNHWAISTPVEAQTNTPLHVRAAGFGLDSVVVDGNDVLAVYAATRAAADRVRAGGPPAFIEAVTYRMAGHSTSDDPRRYRHSAEVETWEALDPLRRLRTLLDQRGWADELFYRQLDEEAQRLAHNTRTSCLALAPPPLEDTFRHTLVHETELLRRQREHFSTYLESFA
jgi:2-oxoisovalerate dehydrogenase E1 component alpha subunit